MVKLELQHFWIRGMKCFAMPQEAPLAQIGKSITSDLSYLGKSKFLFKVKKLLNLTVCRHFKYIFRKVILISCSWERYLALRVSFLSFSLFFSLFISISLLVLSSSLYFSLLLPFFSLLLYFLIFSSDSSSLHNSALLEVRGSHFLRIWAFLPFYL